MWLLLAISTQARHLAKDLRIDINPFNLRAAVVIVARAMRFMTVVMIFMVRMVMLSFMVAITMSIPVTIPMFIVTTAAVLVMMAIVMTITVTIALFIVTTATVLVMMTVIHYNDGMARTRVAMTLCVEKFCFLRLNQRGG
jgi:hypothetical protein